jgi:nitrate reductase (cytochrome), electron transfer subunit
MSPREPLSPAARRRIALIGVAVVGMASGILLLGAALGPEGEAAETASAVSLVDAAIPSEAGQFRLQPGDLASATGERRTGARLRTLVDFRRLRAFPGAPPRVPHALTPEEFRGMTCNNCHATGGYSPRLGAYAPVTPHPEYVNCLQCHAVDDALAGATRSVPASRFAPLEWRSARWPATDQRAMTGSPPKIPHDLDLRGNCLACHAGPGAAEEIRTTHPERGSCRQCHVPTTYDVDDFSRPVAASAGSSGGAR